MRATPNFIPESMSTPRREFLSWLGASTVLAATGTTLGVARAEAESLTAVDPTWDMSWVDRLTGKFKSVFDCPQTSEGAALFRACIWRDQHKQVYGTPRAETSPVLVVRHEAMCLVMNDAYWERFDIGKGEKLKDDKTKKWTRVNPIRAADPDAKGAMKEYNLIDFMAQGGVVLACGLAFRVPVSKFQKADKLSREEADTVARAHLVPGVILQPSGIFAVLRAQEAGCNYVMAS